MRPSVSGATAEVHLERLPDPLRPGRSAMAKAELKKVQKHAQWVSDGAAMGLACSLACLTRKEAAARVGMGENQLAAEIAGAERPQTERFERDPVLSVPMAVAKALRHPEVFEVRWVITAKVPG